MTSSFVPGPGWRPVSPGMSLRDEQDMLTFDSQDGKRSWVREEPLPTLPTERYTVIRATFPDGRDYDLILRDEGWAYLTGNLPATAMIRGIAGFEVLSQPQGVLDAAAEAFEEKLKRVRSETAVEFAKRFDEAWQHSDHPTPFSVLATITASFQ